MTLIFSPRRKDENILYSVMSRRDIESFGTRNSTAYVMCSQPIFWVNPNNHNSKLQKRSHASKSVLRSVCTSHAYRYFQFHKLEKVTVFYLIHSLQKMVLMAVREIVSFRTKQSLGQSHPPFSNFGPGELPLGGLDLNR